MQAEVKLLPCPFCGSKTPKSTNAYSEDVNWTVYCSQCKSTCGFYSNEQRAIESWNTRTFNSRAVAEEIADYCNLQDFVVEKIEAIIDKHLKGTQNTRQ